MKLIARPASVITIPLRPAPAYEVLAPDDEPEALVDVELEADELEVAFVPLIAIALALNASKSFGSTALTLKTMP